MNNNTGYIVFLATNMLWMIIMFVLILLQIIIFPHFGGYMKLDTNATRVHITETMVENKNLINYQDQLAKNQLINNMMQDPSMTDAQKLDALTKYAVK